MRLKISILLILISIGVASCKKPGNQPVIEPEKKPDPVVNPAVDVYVSGTLNNKATYWKNNVAYQISNAIEGTSVANAIAVQGTNVYFAGYNINPSGEKVVTYWKNRIPTYLKNLGITTKDGATGIAVYNNDVYVTGQTERYNGSVQGYSATVWKNGVATYFNNAFDSNANAISITGNGDIYVAGKNEGRACYWKNGAIVYVGESDRNSEAFAIFISGTDVYIAGYSGDDVVNGLLRQAPVYWKNGVKSKLPINGAASALKASSIAVSGTDVHVVGSGLFDGSPNAFIKAIYWKNGVFSDVSATNDAKFLYIANAVAVNGNDIYVAVSTNGKGYLLKNGVQIPLDINGAPGFDYKAITIVPK